MKKLKNTNIVSNNTFIGVNWDAKALEAVNKVAQGLLNLTELFKSQNIKIDCMLKIEEARGKNEK